ncbi:MAG: hypothetical protein K6C10_09140 [Prevotella sp.]|nr:hypothetical protein [Prevotella sp.]
MDEAPSKEQLNELVNSLCELQGRILSVVGPPKHYQQSLAASVEPLKTPIYFLRQMLGYADFPQSRVQHQWLASFKASPPDFLSECIVQIKNGDIPVDDLNLRRTLIDFYSGLNNHYEY